MKTFETMPRSSWLRFGPAFALAICLATCEAPEPAADPAATAAEPAERGARQPEPERAARPHADSGHRLPGRFRAARPGTESSPAQGEQEQIALQLKAIGYLSGSQPARAAGITIHDRGKAYTGLNFFTSGHMEGALLMNMDGEILHEWRYRFPDAFENDPSPKPGKREDWWRRAYLFPNGDVLAIITGSGLFKIDKNSELLWAKAIYSHHDLAIAENGDLYLLTRKVHVVPRVNATQPIVEDSVVVLDSDGNEKRSFSLIEAVEGSPLEDLWRKSGRRSGDIFHTNSIELLDGTAAAENPAFQAGNLLISLLHLNAIAVVDLAKEKVVWAHAGSYRKQHDPKILPNGNLLLFDNHGKRGPSAILEFKPGTMELAWVYRGTPEQPFFSKTCGTSERLPNGNTLISETDFGRAFEVTPDGEIVWEYYNPHRAGDADQFIASLPELIRLPLDFPTDWLEAAPLSSQRGE
jgi:hypothetical protein